jgi:hypothetical protein
MPSSLFLPGLDPTHETNASPTGIQLGISTIINKAAGFFHLNGVSESVQELTNYVDTGGDKATIGSTTGSDTNDPAIYAASDRAYIRTPGTSNNRAYIASSALTSTGLADGLVYKTGRRMYDLNASQRILIAGSDLAFDITSTDTLRANWRDSGGTYQTDMVTTATASFLYGTDHGIGLHIVDANTVRFYYKTGNQIERNTSWTGWTLLEEVTSTGRSYNATWTGTSLDPTSNNNGNLHSSARLYDAYLYNGVEDLYTDINTDNPDANQTSFTATSGQTFTISRSTTGLKTVAIKAGQTLAQSDGTDDYIQLPTSCTPTFTETTGEYTALVCFRSFNIGVTFINSRLLSSEQASSSDGCYLGLNSSGYPVTHVNGATGNTTESVAVNAEASGNTEVAGILQDDGTLYAYLHGSGLSAGESTTTDGAVTHSTTTRLFSRQDAVTNVYNGDLFAAAIFLDALTLAEMDAVSQYLKSIA